jgi:hypothetical protein
MAELNVMARYGLTAADLGWKESAPTIRNNLADSIKAVEAIADEFQAELGRLKASGAFTGVGLKMRAGELGAGTLDRAMRFAANISKGREAIVALDRKISAAAVIGDADSPVVEMRQREVREYLHSLDPLQAQLLIEEGIRLRDGDLDWLAPEDAACKNGCRAVWQSVVLLAIEDSLLPLSTRGASTGLNVGRARNWLSTPSRDRALVCALANVDEGWLETRALPVLVERWQVVDAGPVQPRRRQGDAESRQKTIRPRRASPPTA